MRRVVFPLVLALCAVFFGAALGEAMSVTSQEAYMPNGHYMWILDKNEMASIGMPGLRAAINVYVDGSASGVVFDPDGFVVNYLFLDMFGFLFCSTDGVVWGSCDML